MDEKLKQVVQELGRIFNDNIKTNIDDEKKVKLNAVISSFTTAIMQLPRLMEAPLQSRRELLQISAAVYRGMGQGEHFSAKDAVRRASELIKYVDKHLTKTEPGTTKAAPSAEATG